MLQIVQFLAVGIWWQFSFSISFTASVGAVILLEFFCENWIFDSGKEFIYIFVSLISVLSIKYFSELKFL